ncbi:MAG: hypothetical protein WBB65_09300 [Anaerolineales bacterium]
MINEKNFAILPLLTLLVGLISAFGILLWTPLQFEQSISDGSMIPLSKEAPVGQTLLAHYPGLTRISIPAAGIAEDELGEILFQLSRLDQGVEIPIVQHNEVTISRTTDWIHFQFPPQDDPTGTQYAFYLRQTGETVLHLPMHIKDMYPEGKLSIGEGDLLFRASFEPSWEMKLGHLVFRLSENKPGLPGNPLVYPLLLVFMVASFVGLSWMLLFSAGQPERARTLSMIDKRGEERVQS